MIVDIVDGVLWNVSRWWSCSDGMTRGLFVHEKYDVCNYCNSRLVADTANNIGDIKPRGKGAYKVALLSMVISCPSCTSLELMEVQRCSKT